MTIIKNHLDSILIGAFAFIKLFIHFTTNTNYGLHRDEYLYFDQGKHLSWGFYEVPPFTPIVGTLAEFMGGSVFAIRLFPALAGVLIIVLSCKLVKGLGGGNWAIFITGITMTFTPSLLGANTLFQPVTFNQLFWFLIAYTLVQIIKGAAKYQYYLLGIFIGLAFLTKYSVAFYLFALLVAVLLSKHRNLLKTKHFLVTLSIALIIALPNIVWQFQHDMPLIQHMKELSESQLVHVKWGHFLSSQLIAHKGFAFCWIFGLAGLFTIHAFQKYKCLGIAYLLTVLLIGILQGKSYYTLGALLILFPFGGLTIEYFIKSPYYKSIILVIMFLISIPFYPISFPLMKVNKLQSYCRYLSEKMGINYMLRWEDGNYYHLPQDMADMHGWEELVQRVANIYDTLDSTKQSTCMIYGGSYSHAGAINFFRKKYNLPEAFSLNGSYAYWADKELNFDNQIMIDDRKHDSSQWFVQMVLVDSIQNIYAREKGYIYYRSDPKINVSETWYNEVLKARGE